MSLVSGPSFSVVSLAERAIGALSQADAVSLTKVLADCSQAEIPGSAEEFSRALTQQAAFEKVLEQTGRNIRLLRGEEDDFRYGRNRGRNS
ncbi:MAG TPA: hypothetical protein VMA71_08555 [Alloacidobacterium sp.]|nr:hypothetical protein [Alloacidobacterium sp.]